MSFLRKIINNHTAQVIEHVYEKVMNGGSEGGSGAGTPTGSGKHKWLIIRAFNFHFQETEATVRGRGQRRRAGASPRRGWSCSATTRCLTPTWISGTFSSSIIILTFQKLLPHFYFRRMEDVASFKIFGIKFKWNFNFPCSFLIIKFV